MHSSSDIYDLVLQDCLCSLVADLFSTVAVVPWIKFTFYLSVLLPLLFSTGIGSQLCLLYGKGRVCSLLNYYLGLFLFSIALAEASPFREGDESSVDIYDGLDSSLSVSGGFIVSHSLAWHITQYLLLKLISSKTYLVLSLHLAGETYGSASNLFKFKTYVLGCINAAENS